MKMKSLWLTLLSLGVLCILLLTPASVAAADNLVANGDLEMGSTNSWETPNATLATDVVHGGSYSLKLGATSVYSGAAFKTVPVRKNADITVTFWYRYASQPSSGKEYYLYVYKGAGTDSGNYGGVAFSRASSYTQWKKATFTFNSGDFSAIYLKFSPGGNGSVPCYIDDLVVTSVGGDEVEEAPYLTSFGTKYGRPQNAADNLLKNGGFESANGAQWNGANFIKGNLSVVSDPTAPEGNNSLYFNSGNTATAQWHTFPMTVEKYTHYTFSAWVKSPRLSDENDATATFGVMNTPTQFLVYEPYNGNGNGAASLSTTRMQLMATAPDDEWHLRSVTFYSGSHTTVYIGVYGAASRLYLDDMALFKSAYGVEYISPLRTDVITPVINGGDKYCADEDSLIEGISMTTVQEQQSWSDNPAWRNGFLSFAEVGGTHGTALKYTASAHTAWQLHYIDWIDVKPGTSYTLTLDVKRLAAGGGRIVLLDDDHDAPKEFYTLFLSAVDSDWVTYSVTFDTASYSRIGFAIVDGGGSALIDEVRLFETADSVADKPSEDIPTLKPLCSGTGVSEPMGGVVPVLNGDFENGMNSWDDYQGTVIAADAAYGSGYGAHLKGDGSWGALIEQKNIPVEDGGTYTLTYRYKANSSGTNVTLKGMTSGTQYAYTWACLGQWTYVTATFTVEGDTAVVFNACGGGNGVAEDVYLDNVRLIPEDSDVRLGVAFLMELESYHVTMDPHNRFDAPNAIVVPYGDGESYPLLRMGAVMANVGISADALTLNGVNGSTVVDVPAVYLWNISEDGCEFAVRVVNVPLSESETLIYARPYYVFEKDGQEIVVYGDVYSRSYDE